MTQAELARRMDRPLKTINEIVKGKAALTPETAIQLERTLGITARFWNSLEANYREALARQEATHALERESAWVEHFPLNDLMRHGLVAKGAPNAEVLSTLLDFFRVSNTKAWERHWLKPLAEFRGSRRLKWSEHAVATWLRWGEIEASRVETDTFDAARFRDALRQIRNLTAHGLSARLFEDVRKMCAECGVAVVATPELQGAPLSGAARWLRSDMALIQLSLRYKSDDQFWFSFFHEGGHLVESRSRRDHVDSFEGSGNDGAEERANEFARNTLIPPDAYAELVSGGEISASAIREFARKQRISPGIVVGRLQFDGVLNPSQFSSLKKRVGWTHSTR